MDIALTCFINPSGISKAGREYFRFLDGEGFRVIPVLLMPPEEWQEAIDQSLYAKMVDAAMRPLGEQFIQIHAGIPNAMRMIKGAKAIYGSVIFEGATLSPDQMRGCMAMTAALTPSTFCRNACLTSGMPKNKVFLVPYPLDSSRWHPSVSPLLPKNERFRFLYVNTWYERKGYDVLLRAWWQEFSKDDQVELCLKSYREADRDEKLEVIVALLASSMGVDRSKKAPVTIIDKVFTDGSMPGFMKSFDAIVSPHRSEGFGLNLWYAMAIGLPVICTNYGGVLDFVCQDTAWLVRTSGMSKPNASTIERFPELRGALWAEPSVDDLRRQMRLCVDSPVEREKRASVGAVLVAKKYGTVAIREAFKEAVNKTTPGAWDAMCSTRSVEAIASQTCDRFESAEKPISLPEV